MIEQAQATKSEDTRNGVSKVLYEEFVNINPRLLFAQLLAAPLPIFTLNRVRRNILRLAGFDIGAGTVVWGMPTFIGGPGLQNRLKIGQNGLIGVQLFFDLTAPIMIGDYVGIGPGCMFLTTNHRVGPAGNRTGEPDPRPIVIGSGCWFGARVIVLPGVTIGKGCIIGAGAVVSKDIPDNTFAAGVPARPIKEIHE